VDSGRDSDFDDLVRTRAVAETTPAAATAPNGGVMRTTVERLRGRFASTPERAQFFSVAGPVGVTLIAAGTRLWNLGDPHTLVFDETFYVKDSYSLSHLGYESQWPANADQSFASGNTDIFLKTASFVVHPPLGKWLISLGYLAFGGAGDPVSWRISTAIVGILAVVVLMLIAKKLFGSTLVATIAGLLMAIDGNAIVMSRVSLLDNFVMFFALLGFGALLLDREWTARRLAMWIGRRAQPGKGIDWGPALWWRPWLIAAGLAFGLTASIKWNGIYFLAGFAIYTVVVDAIARKAAGVPFWLSGTLWKQAPTTFLLTVPVAVAAYLATWTGWFVTKGGYDRGWATIAGNEWKGALAWVPRSLQSLWHFETEVYNYHVNLHTPHSYQANPLGWLLLIRPTNMYFEGASLGEKGCTVSYCGSQILDIANPLIWWAGTAAAIYLLYRLIRFREWRVGFVLAGLGIGYLPWLLYIGRTVFQFYSIAFEPYLLLSIAYVVWLLIARPEDPPWRRQNGLRIVAVYLFVVLAVSVYYWPLWVGIQVDWRFVTIHYWLASWL
jgi:dolichyl-phosphate-mannose--protein O-mannosyl transferase